MTFLPVFKKHLTDKEFSTNGMEPMDTHRQKQQQQQQQQQQPENQKQSRHRPYNLEKI